MNRRAVAIVGLSIALAGCGTEDEARPLSLPAGAVYRSPLGNFTCIVPTLLDGHAHEAERVRDGDPADASATVTFADDFGSLLQIESDNIGPNGRPVLDGPNRRAALDAYFDQPFFPDRVRARFPDARVVHREFVQPSPEYASVGDALFAVVRPSDGVQRGYLMFPVGDYLYVVTTREWPSMVRDVNMPQSSRIDRLRSDLLHTVAAMTFAR